MLTRRENIGTPERYVADSLIPKPSVAHTVFNDFAIGFATPFVGLDNLNTALHPAETKPQGRALRDTLNIMKLENMNPRIGGAQKVADELASLVGYGVNPIMWGFGEIGGLVAKGVGRGIEVLGANAEGAIVNAANVFARTPLKETLSKWLPEEIGREGSKKLLTPGLVGQKTLNAFGIFAGAGVPIALADNFNLDTNHINWGGVARDSGTMGAFGIAVGSIPLAWGVLRGKLNRARGVPSETVIEPNYLNEALQNGVISQAEHQWYTDYLEAHKSGAPKPETMADIESRATAIVGDNGHPVNTVSNEGQFDILSPKTMRELQNAIPDQLVSDVPATQRTALSDFLIHNNLDSHRERPQSLDGIRGYVDFINQKLTMRVSKTIEADKMLDDHLLRGIKENMPLSQKQLLNNIRKMGLNAKAIDQLPVVVPKNIRSRIKGERQIQLVREKIKTYEKRLKATGDKRFQDRIDKSNQTISKIEKTLTPTLHPNEELMQLRKALISENGKSLIMERSNDYHRLLDLADVWHNARTLLDRVHMERDYESQTAFKTLAESVLKVADSDLPRLAKPENVVDYLKARVEGVIYKREPLRSVEERAVAKSEVPVDADTILSEQERQVEESIAKDLSKEFHEASDKFKEFKASEGIFKNLIDCVLGGMNG